MHFYRYLIYYIGRLGLFGRRPVLSSLAGSCLRPRNLSPCFGQAMTTWLLPLVQH